MNFPWNFLAASVSLVISKGVGVSREQHGPLKPLRSSAISTPTEGHSASCRAQKQMRQRMRVHVPLGCAFHCHAQSSPTQRANVSGLSACAIGRMASPAEVLGPCSGGTCHCLVVTYLRRVSERLSKVTQKAPAYAGPVLLTREEGKNKALMDSLSQEGISTLELPLIAAVPGPDVDRLPLVLRDEAYDYIILTSPEAADVFLRGWRDAGQPQLSIAAVGKGMYPTANCWCAAS